MFRSKKFASLLVFISALQISGAQDQPGRVAWDFEKQALTSEWSAGGKITAAREVGEKVAPPKPARADDLLPGGQMVKLEAQPGSFFAQKKELPRVAWERAERISFWVSRTEDEAKRDADCTLDVLFLDATSRALFSRKVVVKGTGWQQVELPLEWVAPASGRVGSWPAVHRLALSFREESRLALDAIQADLAAQPRPPLSLASMIPIAFPASDPKQIKSAERAGFVVATNAADCDPAVVADVLDPLVKQLAGDLPLGEATNPARLLIFASRDEYRQFTPRLAAKFNKEAAQPMSDGYTLLGWATSSWDPQQGVKRPVFAHEFVHSLLEARLQLPNQSEWFQEGLATYYQMQLYPQKNLPDIIHGGIARGDFDLSEITSGKPIPVAKYWQAMTVCSLLVRDPAYKPQLKELIAAFQKSGSTNLEPQLAGVLKTDFAQLTEHWKKHCREAFPTGKP